MLNNAGIRRGTISSQLKTRISHIPFCPVPYFTASILPDHPIITHPLTMADDDNITQHALVSSWFLGPRAENFQVLHDLFGTVLNHQAQARKTLYAGDPEFITEGMKELEDYQNSIKTLTSDVDKLSLELAAKSVPFWSPRYNAHMNMDVALSSIVGCMWIDLLFSLLTEVTTDNIQT